MKTKIEVPTTVDPSIEFGEAELTYVPDFQTKPLVVRGPEEALRDMAAQMIQEDKRQPRRKAIAVPKAVMPETTAVDTSIVYSGPAAAKARIRARLFDVVYRSHVAEDLIADQNAERELAFRRSLGMRTVGYCAKHEKALAGMKG